MKILLSLTVALCGFAVYGTSTMAAGFIEEGVQMPRLILALIVWASLPPISVSLLAFYFRLKKTTGVVFMVCSSAIIGLGCVGYGYAFKIEPDAFTGPVVPLFVIPLLQCLALMCTFFLAALATKEGSR